MFMTKKGAGAGGIEYSRSRRRRMAAKKRAEEQRWAAKSGPVTITRRDQVSTDDPLEDDGAPPLPVKDGTEPQAVLDREGRDPRAGN